VVEAGPATIDEAPIGDGQDLTTTLDDQAELAITVYNSDIALVRDVRNLTLTRGAGNLRFMDIAATVNPATVHFRSLTEPSQVSVLEQNYEYDLLEPDKLLRKYVGREVTLMRNRSENGSTRQEEVKALLLSYNAQPVWKIGNEIVTGMGADHIRFPSLPETLYSRPTLIWTVQNDGAAKHRVEASYLASRLAWNADYVLTVGRDDKAADLNGWVTLVNNSGTAFRNAKLQLVAGDLNRVRQQLGKMLADVGERRAEAPAAANMTQEAFSDYHLYTMQRKTTIGNAFDVVCERKQIDFTKIASNVYEFEYEITLRNHKATAVSVEVNEPIGGTWRMLRSSHESEKTSAWAAQFKVPVASDGTAVLKYRVRVTY
jgi:hypothetical protein